MQQRSRRRSKRPGQVSAVMASLDCLTASVAGFDRKLRCCGHRLRLSLQQAYSGPTGANPGSMKKAPPGRLKRDDVGSRKQAV